jgi:hypothetical protein
LEAERYAGIRFKKSENSVIAAPPAASWRGPGEQDSRQVLGFLHGYRTRLTDFNAALAAETFVRIDRNRLSVLHFKNFNRAHFDTFFAALAFLVVHNGIKSHFSTPPFLGY